ncbi:MAG: MBL fold metallo-hydrolase [Desulfobacterales bacterium]|nr:MBL fold metallo-hydrolase [Desulfobacterales bacterium]
MNFTISTIVENTISASLIPFAEHGLSFLITAGNKKILFDSGKGQAFLPNADAMNINLTEIETVVLSHGHFDHANGLKELMSRNKNFKVIAHPAIFDNKLAGIGGTYFPIGISETRENFEKNGIKFQLSKESVEIIPGIITTGEIPMESEFEEVEPMFFTGEKGKEVRDYIPDDLALIIDTKKGLVVLLGCAHRGIINTLNHVSKLTGKKKIHAIMGGLHLLFADQSKLKKISDLLKGFELEKLIIGHCTGIHAIVTLFNEFKDKVVLNTVGHTIQF